MIPYSIIKFHEMHWHYVWFQFKNCFISQLIYHFNFQAFTGSVHRVPSYGVCFSGPWPDSCRRSSRWSGNAELWSASSSLGTEKISSFSSIYWLTLAASNPRSGSWRTLVRKSFNFCFNFGEWGVTALNSKTLKLRKIYILFWGCGIRCEVRFPILELDKYKRIFSQSHLKEMLKIHEKSVFKLLFDQGMESDWCWSSCQFCKVKFEISVDNSKMKTNFLFVHWLLYK